MNEEDFLALAKSKYAEIQALNEQPTFLEYEKEFVGLWAELGRQVSQANLGGVGKDHRKKENPQHPRPNRSDDLSSLYSKDET